MTGRDTRQLALFDFDGTLTRKDTLAEIIKFIHGRGRFYTGLLRLSPFLLLYKCGLISNRKAKEKMLVYFFGGMSCKIFRQKCDQFITERLPALLRKDAMDTLMQFKKAGARIIVVSASPEDWIAPWCKAQGIGCIATRLETEDGKLTGRIKGENCHGREKISRIQQAIDLSEYSEIHAYGDSAGDRYMLQLATHPYYRTFKNSR